jgi:S-formylglutathione hydrolase FrmB
MKTYFIIIILAFCQVWGGKTETVEIFSHTMNKNIPAIIVTPDSYGYENDSIPVILLLHGYGGDYTNWSSKTELRHRADEYNIIFVCPDGSRNSWYMDSPLDSTIQYETFFINELIPWINKNFRSSHLGITGLSMGGHGALYLAIRHPKLFDAVSSMSGGVDLTFSTVKWEITKMLGSIESFPNRWHSNSIVNMVESIPKGFIPVLIDCGYDDFFIDLNRTLHHRMVEKNISHIYVEKPGGHSWNYWVNALDEHLQFFENAFNGITKN